VLLRPPSSTLFPYTTLFRSEQIAGLKVAAVGRVVGEQLRGGPVHVPCGAAAQAHRLQLPAGHFRRLQPCLKADGKSAAGLIGLRSEEHTSELQSRENLVCRL